eukprot:TRINITY_DN7433_c0_g1_i1.p1 TRINITY_DN7433_c0_g1~~TRINITY_DN7433_c0_g1_i1.p1  ORF type:complete len:187 (+),score=22.23 TRINITY_DN7433_c0_g1_i1:58-618(+)
MSVAIITIAVCSMSVFHGIKNVTIPIENGEKAFVRLVWVWDPPYVTTTMTVDSTTKQDLMWIAMAYNTVGSMVGGDYVIGYTMPDGYDCVGPSGCDEGPPPNSPTSFFIDQQEYYHSNGEFNMGWRRRLDTGHHNLTEGEPITTLFAAAKANPALTPRTCPTPFGLDRSQIHTFFKSNSTIITFSG